MSAEENLHTQSTHSSTRVVIDAERLLLVMGLDGSAAVNVLSKIKFALANDTQEEYYAGNVILDQLIERHITSERAAKQPFINLEDNHGTVAGTVKNMSTSLNPKIAL